MQVDGKGMTDDENATDIVRTNALGKIAGIQPLANPSLHPCGCGIRKSGRAVP
jgi:hypothetical protein